jgi:hypothetical protein
MNSATLNRQIAREERFRNKLLAAGWVPTDRRVKESTKRIEKLRSRFDEALLLELSS